MAILEDRIIDESDFVLRGETRVLPLGGCEI